LRSACARERIALKPSMLDARCWILAGHANTEEHSGACATNPLALVGDQFALTQERSKEARYCSPWLLPECATGSTITWTWPLEPTSSIGVEPP
jgi:hypothetical protein